MAASFTIAGNAGFLWQDGVNGFTMPAAIKTAPLCVAYWFKYTDTTAGNAFDTVNLINKQDDPTNNRFSFDSPSDDNFNALGWRHRGGGNDNTLPAGVSITQGQWNHVIFNEFATTRRSIIAEGDEQSAESTATVDPSGINAILVGIGHESSGDVYQNPWQGEIYDLAIFRGNIGEADGETGSTPTRPNLRNHQDLLEFYVRFDGSTALDMISGVAGTVVNGGTIGNTTDPFDFELDLGTVTPGANTPVKIGTAGEAITQGDIVYFDTATATYKKALGYTKAGSKVAGISFDTCAANQPFAFADAGDINITTSLIVGQPLVVSPWVVGAGKLVYYMDAPPGSAPGVSTRVSIVGYVKSANVITIDRINTGVFKSAV